MYLTFYGLTEKPFNPTPDPRFLYMCPGHREALAQLQYGVQERKGFILLTGRVGTGKTTLLNALRQRLDGQTAVAFVFNSTLTFDGILECAQADLGIADGATSRARRLITFNNFLIERQRAGHNTVLILDEAQNLDPATLEQIRLLSNFETPTSKVLQILLVGQPELRARLALPELRQLSQRVALRCQLSPLTPVEVRQYLRNRLRVAGARDMALFTDPAVDRLTKFAGGVPRLVNTIADHCLLFGYADNQRRIERSTVDRAVEYLEEGTRPRRTVHVPGVSRARELTRSDLGSLALAVASAAVAIALWFQTAVPSFVQSVSELLFP
ncbi:MAG: hypothetical protein DMD96_28780 [Candidatus Rokuibacteriota bacterium]|nr:MAG: hypothetical protein DMD96_28780 [Candidatus Rokubacteria bacterium]